jgi:hypothetical protein
MFEKHHTEVGQNSLDTAIAAAQRCMPAPYGQQNGQCVPGACNDGNYLKVSYVGGFLGTLAAPTALLAGASATITIQLKVRFKGARLILPHDLVYPNIALGAAAIGADLFVTNVEVDNQNQLGISTGASGGTTPGIPAAAFDNLNGYDGAGRLDFKTAEISSTISVTLALLTGGTARPFVSVGIQGVMA